MQLLALQLDSTLPIDLPWQCNYLHFCRSIVYDGDARQGLFCLCFASYFPLANVATGRFWKTMSLSIRASWAGERKTPGFPGFSWSGRGCR
jgi:hypothetical protein